MTEFGSSIDLWLIAEHLERDGYIVLRAPLLKELAAKLLIRCLQSGRSGLWSSERIKRARHSTTHHTAAMGIDHGSTDVAVT